MFALIVCAAPGLRPKANRETVAHHLAAQMAQSALLKQVGELEKEVTDLKAWDAEKEKYHLVELRINVAPGHGGALAFALKEQAGSSEPIHFLCPDCYQEGRKSILQEEKRVPGMVDILWCNRCGAEINRTGITYEKTPRQNFPIAHAVKRRS